MSEANGEKRSPIAVVGVGAIGGAIAAHLLSAGRDVRLCVRRGFERLELETPGGQHGFDVATQTAPDAEKPTAWVLLATKAHQVSGAARWLSTLCGPDSVLAVLQNGVEHEAGVRPFRGEAEVLPVVVSCPTERLALGKVVQRGPARLEVPAGETGRRFAALFNGTAVAVEPVQDFREAAWRKLCGNVATGAVTALTGRRMEVFRDPDVVALARGLALEAIAVARAEGVELEDEFADSIAASLVGANPMIAPSMLADRRAGRSLEVDARNGAVVRIGARHGVAAPLNHAVSALLRALGPPGSRRGSG